MNLRQYRRKHLFMVFLLTGLMMLVLLRHVAGQSNSDSGPSTVNPSPYDRSYFVNGGLGFGGSGNALLIELNLQCSDKGMLSFGFEGVGPLDKLYYAYNTTTAASFYLGYGKIKKGRSGIASWSVGPAYTQITKYGDVPLIPLFPALTTTNYAASLHLQAEMFWAGSMTGLGLTAFADINGTYPYAGLTLSLALGKVNPLKK